MTGDEPLWERFESHIYSAHYLYPPLMNSGLGMEMSLWSSVSKEAGVCELDRKWISKINK